MVNGSDLELGPGGVGGGVGRGVGERAAGTFETFEGYEAVVAGVPFRLEGPDVMR